MNTPIITQTGHPLFQIRAEAPRLKRSLLSVVRHRFLSWLEKATLRAIGVATFRLLTIAAIAAVVFVPQFLLGLLSAAATWNGYRIPAFLVLLALTLYGRQAWRWFRRVRIKRRGSNQHTFEGLPVGLVVDHLTGTGAWKRDETLARLAIGEPTWKQIGDLLEQHGVLVRSKVSNARVLADISRPMLVRQLRDDFPLVWDEIGKCWVEKDDPYGRHLREKAFRTRKLEEETARIERKAERAERRLDKTKEEMSAFASIMGVGSPDAAYPV